MKRVYGATIVLATLLLALGIAGSILSTGSQTQQSTALAAIAPEGVVAQVSTDTRKLPPPPSSIKPVPPNPSYRPQACTAPVINVSQQRDNQAESFVVINPTNPNNIVVFSNMEIRGSIFRAYSMNGGVSWTRGTVATDVACCDGQAAFDAFGNLFLVYLNNSYPSPTEVNVILSTDGGANFSSPVTVDQGSQVDQPSIAVGNGSVWVDWNVGGIEGSILARGAPVTGLGMWGPFGPEQAIPGATGTFGGIAVGPGVNGGKVMVTYMRLMDPNNSEGPTTVYVNVDADGLGSGGFGPRITAATTNVGLFDSIPAQSIRSIDAEAGLVWDATSGLLNNRAYLVYTEEPTDESNDTEIYLRTSTDDGMTWSAPVRVNDDPLGTIRSQFNPYITLDPTSGTVAIGWHDVRNDNGVPGSGGTNNIPNDDSEYYASYSTDGGVSWAANTRLSGGFSNAANARSPVDYGDYVGTNAFGGKFVGVWADNSNCDGTNPDGALSAFDLYMGTMNLPAVPTPTPTPTPISCSNPGNYTVQERSDGSIGPRTQDISGNCGTCVVPVRLDFPYTLYDERFDTAIVGTNGTLAFVRNDNPPYPGNRTCMPFTSFDYSILPHWGNLYVQTGDGQRFGCYPNNPCGIYTSVSGQAPNRVFTIQWRACQFNPNNPDAEKNVRAGDFPCGSTGDSGRVDFEVRLFEGQTRFDTVYGSLAYNGFGTDIGVQRDTGSRYTEYSCDTQLPGGVNRLIFTYCPLATPTPPPPPTNTPTRTATPTPSPTMVTGCGVFQDVAPDNVFYPYIRCLGCRNIISGYSGDPNYINNCWGGQPEIAGYPYFRYCNPIIRGQTAKMVSNAAGFTESIPTDRQTFEDVKNTHTFWLWIERLAARGIVSGYMCGQLPTEPCGPLNRPYFRPMVDVTRGQLSKIVSNARQYSEIPPLGQQTFEDVPPSNTFWVFIERLASRGIINGYQCGGPGEPCGPLRRPYFRPFASSTRGQTSKIVARAFFPECNPTPTPTPPGGGEPPPPPPPPVETVPPPVPTTGARVLPSP